MNNYEKLYKDILMKDSTLSKLDLIESIQCAIRKLRYMENENGHTPKQMADVVEKYYCLKKGCIEEFKKHPTFVDISKEIGFTAAKTRSICNDALIWLRVIGSEQTEILTSGIAQIKARSPFNRIAQFRNGSQMWRMESPNPVPNDLYAEVEEMLCGEYYRNCDLIQSIFSDVNMYDRVHHLLQLCDNIQCRIVPWKQMLTRVSFSNGPYHNASLREIIVDSRAAFDPNQWTIRKSFIEDIRNILTAVGYFFCIPIQLIVMYLRAADDPNIKLLPIWAYKNQLRKVILSEAFPDQKLGYRFIPEIRANLTNLILDYLNYYSDIYKDGIYQLTYEDQLVRMLMICSNIQLWQLPMEPALVNILRSLNVFTLKDLMMNYQTLTDPRKTRNIGAGRADRMDTIIRWTYAAFNFFIGPFELSECQLRVDTEYMEVEMDQAIRERKIGIERGKGNENGYKQSNKI